MDEEMRLEKVLGVARDGMSPTDADQARLRRTLAAAAAGTAVAVSTTQVAAASAGKVAGAATQIGAGHTGLFGVVTGLSTGAKLVAVGVCVTAAATGVFAVRAQSPASVPAIHAPAVQGPASVAHKAAGAAHTQTDEPVIAEPQPAAIQPEVQAAQPSNHGTRAAKGPHPVAQSKVDAPNPLTAELVLIQSARQSLKAGNPSAALSALSAHATQFPAGVMTEERRALQALALCAVGDPRGKQQADQFLKETPDSPLAAHLRDGCQ